MQLRGMAVTVSARLHLGFLDLNGEFGRQFGSLEKTFRSASRADASTIASRQRGSGPLAGLGVRVSRCNAKQRLLYALSQNADDPAEPGWERALLFDASLKRCQRRLNPGTTADLTVATLFVRRPRDLGLPDFSPDTSRQTS